MRPLPEEIRRTIRADHWQVNPDPEEHRRRSLWLFVRRNLRDPFLEVFDRPDTNASCARRARTTTAPQALTLLHAPETFESAEHLAGAILAHAAKSGETNDRARWIAAVFERLYARAPAAAELAIAIDFLDEAAAAGDGRAAARAVPAGDAPLLGGRGLAAGLRPARHRAAPRRAHARLSECLTRRRPPFRFRPT